MDWTAGYASDIEYTAGFYREQSPAYLNFVCVLKGFEPVPLDRPFTYFELGFGRGLTVNLLAAANPQGQFYAADFNPTHVAGAREMASAAGLDNLTLYEESFEELANGKEDDLPQFDFITLHGIYTWVTAENQAHIVKFIARYLKPGGVVYLSYNAMPGWAPALPLQRLLVEYADAFPDRSDVQIAGAAALVGRLQAAGANYIAGNPGLEARLKMLNTGNPNYLVHEYMHKHWAPRYHADVARDLSAAKLDFVGSTDLTLAYPEIFLAGEKAELVNAINGSAMRETMKDYILNTSFRKDVFVRGARKMTNVRQADWLRKVGLALMVGREAATTDLKLSVGQVNGRDDIYGPLFDALAIKPHTLGELQRCAGLEKVSIADLAQAAALLVATGQAELYSEASLMQAKDTAHGLNRALCNMTRYSDDYHALCSPLLGNGIGAGFMERLVYHVLAAGVDAGDTHAVAKALWVVLLAQGRLLIVEGQTLQTEAENIGELERQAGAILASRLPLWRKLHML